MTADGFENATRSCPVCSSAQLSGAFHVAFPQPGPESRVVWASDERPNAPAWSFDRCAECGLCFANPPPTRKLVESYYFDQEAPSGWELVHYVAATTDRVAYWNEFADRLTRLVGKPGRLLEVGPAAGHLLRAAEDQGWAVTGVEASPKFARIVERSGLEVHQGVLETFDAGGAPFDAIVLIDVLEHLVDPVADLRRCRNMLASDGRIVVATCDIGSFAARYYGRKWRQYVISHTFYWTRRSLALAFERAGLEVLNVSSVRWWDPDPRRERRQRVREWGKFAARKTLQKTWMPAIRRSPLLVRLQRALSRGRLDLAALEHKVGDQAVMADVVLMVGRRREAAAKGAPPASRRRFATSSTNDHASASSPPPTTNPLASRCDSAARRRSYDELDARAYGPSPRRPNRQRPH